MKKENKAIKYFMVIVSLLCLIATIVYYRNAFNDAFNFVGRFFDGEEQVDNEFMGQNIGGDFVEEILK